MSKKKQKKPIKLTIDNIHQALRVLGAVYETRTDYKERASLLDSRGILLSIAGDMLEAETKEAAAVEKSSREDV